MRAAMSSWASKRLDAWRSRLYVSDQSCAPVWASTSWALTRMAEPPPRRLPSSRYRAPSLAPRARSSPSTPFRRAAEALVTTERYRNRDRPVPISSESPSARAARSALAPAYLNGSTATDNAAEPAGGVVSRGALDVAGEDCSDRLNAISLADWN